MTTRRVLLPEGIAGEKDINDYRESPEILKSADIKDSGFPAPLDWARLKDVKAPERVWATRGWVPMGHTTLLAGLGGLGKTLLAQTLGTCLAMGRDYFDEVPESRKVLMWAGEDDADELHRRQEDICRWMDLDMGELEGRFMLHPCNGADITLAEQINGHLAPTSALKELREKVSDTKPEVIILDSTARVYGGNENDRHQVTQFVSWLDNAAQGAAVMLLAHPAKGQGSEYSGTTAWEGSVRSRLFLSPTLPDGDPDEGSDTDDTRYLTRRKANYSGKDWRRFEYRDGVLIPESAAPKQRFGPQYAQDVVLRALRKLTEMGTDATASTASPSYAPKVAKEYGLLDGIDKRQFAAAMREMLKAGRLKTDVVGQYPNRSPKKGLVEVHK
ncbi:AAA family ATPase [Thioalkalivibrio thiocyanodenitrificans]|uniref:AAA family ATPase n=1 Tax=Thioalkalivibrio thiocyanodenitrificans TaxID=243063 RepID=UPI00036685BB|nr:AAA family ATPase [Thioalkalivibrio thiocyanodenitrificans]